jgi:hypothetical protein
MYFSFSTTIDKCTHVSCSCEVTVQGIHPITDGIMMKYPLKDSSKVLAQVLTEILNKCALIDGVPSRVHSHPTYNYYLARAISRSNKRIPAPFRGPDLPMDRLFFGIDSRIQHSFQQADRRYWNSYGVYIDNNVAQKYIWPEKRSTDDLSLVILAARAASWHNQVLHNYKGRPTAVNALDNMYPTKLADNTLKMLKETRDLPPHAAHVMRQLPKAIDMMYDKMGIHEFATEPCVITFKDLEGVYLGSSGGLEPPDGRTCELPGGEKIKVSTNAKKICKLESDLGNVINLIESDIDFLVTYAQNPKSEMFMGIDKQKSDEKWDKLVNKLRIFTVPNSPFIIANKLVNRVRHLKERGIIRIGHKWPHGGWDVIARILSKSRDCAFLDDLVEGDVTGLDFSVDAFFTRLYYSFGLVHEQDDSPAYELKKKILIFILKNVVTRITKAFGEIWEIIFGKVPSGVLDTSHMDSWVKALWFFLFMTFTISEIPDKRERMRVARWAALMVAIIVYGDDFLYKKGVGALAAYFSGEKYKVFLERYFNVELRDVFDGISLCSIEHHGWLIHRGVSFLKMHCVLNPKYTPTNGQCWFLPFRETREILVRCYYGREPKSRTVIDAVSSTISHAYGTFGANDDAYRYLEALYKSLMYDHGLNEAKTLEEVVSKKSAHDMKQFRQIGMDIAELQAGFPTKRVLEEKNTWDKEYHNITVGEMHDSEGLDWNYEDSCR